MIFIDETSFTNTDQKMKAWSRPKENIMIVPAQKVVKNHSVITAISNKGLMHFKIV